MTPKVPGSPAYVAHSSGIHGTGMFAARAIRRGERIIEYIGEVIDKKESERRALVQIKQAKRSGSGAVYIFTLDEEWDLDGAGVENQARLINHSCDPNTEVWNEENRLWIHALRPIAKGEELTYNYGFDFETWEDHPCRCGSARCVGYIVAEDQWPALRRAIAARRNRHARPDRPRAAGQTRQTRPTGPPSPAAAQATRSQKLDPSYLGR
jgi:uncharacterized protein